MTRRQRRTERSTNPRLATSDLGLGDGRHILWGPLRTDGSDDDGQEHAPDVDPEL